MVKTRRLQTALYIFFFNDTATTEIYTLSLHDALPISSGAPVVPSWHAGRLPPQWKHPGCMGRAGAVLPGKARPDRKSTRLNSSHANISYAVFCLKKKTNPPAYPLRCPHPASSYVHPLS